MSDQVSPGESVGIESTDCTPKPRYRETSEDFDRRMVALGREVQALKRHNAVRNRTAAVRQDAATGLYAARCACRWHGLAVADAEVARREYDAHSCSMDDVEIGVSLHRKEPLSANWAEETKAMLELERSLLAMTGPEEYRQTPVMSADDAVERFRLLELK